MMMMPNLWSKTETCRKQKGSLYLNINIIQIKIVTNEINNQRYYQVIINVDIQKQKGMLKPKNISIKKVTQTDPHHQSKKNRNSRKSLKAPKRQLNHPSPINIMKQDTNNDDSQSDHGNFIKYINGYLNQLDSGKGQSKVKNSEKNEIEFIKRKILREKEINRSMQKNIVQFQRILLERTDKLDKLQNLMRKIQSKQNDKNLINLQSQSRSRHKITRKMSTQEVSSELQVIGSDQSSQVYEENCNRYKQRRNTQMPSQIERIISRTVGVRPQKLSRHKI